MIGKTPRLSNPSLRWLIVVSALIAAPTMRRASGETITTQRLLEEMTDRDALASFPSPAYRALQASSFDRASQSPDMKGWTANRDYSQFLRTDQHQGRTERVMMEAEGPGAVV
ncbi:MAG: hypothetical protein AAFU85_30010, partial [Planctomycetota bacterium]